MSRTSSVAWPRRRTAAPTRLALLLALGFASVASSATFRAKLPDGARAALVDASNIYLEAPPLPGEGLWAFCRRLTGAQSGCRQIAELNRRPRRLLADRRYRVPYEMLTDDRKLAVVRALFPDDRSGGSGWVHHTRGEARSKVAAWFTGNERNDDALGAANPGSSARPRAGAQIVVPDQVLLAVFRAPASAASPPAPQAPSGAAPSHVGGVAVGGAAAGVPGTAGAAATSGTEEQPALEYGEDGLGKYAIYRLRGGEALYSAVVVRFTGRDHADDVNALAREIARRNAIDDVTDIPIGFPVKIPVDVLLPEFLPPGDARRLEWEVEQKLAVRFRNPVRASGLEGVTVVLDAGHGGADVGASKAGVWESIYVYDVMLRVRRALETRTLAKVATTTRDGARLEIVERDVLPYSRGHAVLTTPPYPIQDATVGVHLRWYLANSIFRTHVAKGDSDRIVFLSIHADSLHPSLRGATVYIPNAAGTGGTFGKLGSTFSQRKEYREQPRVSFPLATRQKSEGRSRDLAEQIIAGFRGHQLPVHPYQPVRDRIFRGRRAWVPAVLRYNAIPAKVLVEICNLNNDDDRRELLTASFRETIANAIVDGVLAYFGKRR